MMSIFQFFRILWARRWIVGISTLACFLAGIVALFVVPKTYEATAGVLLDLSKTDPFNASGVSPTFARSYVPSEAEFIESYRVGARAAENLGWTRDPRYRAQYDAFVAASDDKADIPTIANWLGNRISNNVNAVQYLSTNVINITYKGHTAVEAAQMANAIRQAYADETIAQRRNGAAQAVAWLERQMAALAKQREAAEDRLAAYQKATGVLLLGSTGNDADSSLLQAIAQAGPPAGSSVAGGSAGSPNAAQIAALDAKIRTESETLGPNHPIIQDLRAQRAALASAPVPQGPRTISGPSRSSLLEQQGAKVLAQSDKVGEAKRLLADVDAMTAQYQTMATREAALRQEMNTNSAVVVPLDPAVPPNAPSSPKTPLVLIGSFGFGLFSGVLIALILEFMRRRVRGIEDLVAATNVPVIGVINAPPVALAA